MIEAQLLTIGSSSKIRSHSKSMPDHVFAAEKTVAPAKVRRPTTPRPRASLAQTSVTSLRGRIWRPVRQRSASRKLPKVDPVNSFDPLANQTSADCAPSRRHQPCGDALRPAQARNDQRISPQPSSAGPAELAEPFRDRRVGLAHEISAIFVRLPFGRGMSQFRRVR